jgi:enamine deaminase RidA (YjgF/YER057c/UK114 family)
MKSFWFLVISLSGALVFSTVSYAAGSNDEYNPEKKLTELAIKLGTPAKPVANYVQAVRTGHYLYLAGHGSQRADGSYITGKVGKDLTLEQGREAARVTAINLLATLKGELGDLRKVRRIVKVLGMVNATAEFTEHPKVINGASDLLVEIFGKERGQHARSAVGMISLPFNIATEIEMIVEIEE